MSLSICTNCLARLQLAPPTIALVRPFSSTTPKPQAPSTSRKGPPKYSYRVSTSPRIKNTPRVVPKLPMIGERKAHRKRIVLSNTNALEVEGMQDLTAVNMRDPAGVGQVLALNGQLIDQLRALKAFKATQNWNMFRKPGTLMRRESVELGRAIAEIQGSAREGKAVVSRRIVTGERNTGKSMLLLQAMSMALLNEWVVIHVPEGQEWIIAHSNYSPLNTSEKGTDTTSQTPEEQLLYSQPKLVAELLARIAKANTKVLTRLPLSKPMQFDNVTPRNLHELVMIGADSRAISWPVWQTLWRELTAPPQSSSPTARPPVLLTIDGINHWMGPSKYRSASYELVHAHQLAPLRHFFDILFNHHSSGLLGAGGMVIAATTASNEPSVPDFELLLRQIEAVASGKGVDHSAFPMPAPYQRLDARVLGLLEGSEGTGVLRLGGLEKYTEARGLLEYFARSGLFAGSVSVDKVAELWSLSGGGVVGEFSRFGKRVR